MSVRRRDLIKIHSRCPGTERGLAGLLLKLDSRPKIILFAVGLMLDFALGIFVVLLHQRIELLMKEIGRPEE